MAHALNSIPSPLFWHNLCKYDPNKGNKGRYCLLRWMSCVTQDIHRDRQQRTLLPLLDTYLRFAWVFCSSEMDISQFGQLGQQAHVRSGGTPGILKWILAYYPIAILISETSNILIIKLDMFFNWGWPHCLGQNRTKRTFTYVQYIPRNMHTVFALLCFVVVIHWLIFPYPSGLRHWHCGNLTIAPVPAKQPWRVWINTSCEFIMNDCVTTTKQSTTKPCAYFLGYTVRGS